MAKLVGRVTGRKSAGTMRDTFLRAENSGDPLPVGIRLEDGTFHSLEGQPPTAQSQGWGNMSFLRFRSR